MRTKTLKRNKKQLSLYEKSFGFRQPYQIIVDGTFCQTALNQKIFLPERLEKFLGSNGNSTKSGGVKLIGTDCIVQELKALDRASRGEFRGAVLATTKRHEIRKCPHYRLSRQQKNDDKDGVDKNGVDKNGDKNNDKEIVYSASNCIKNFLIAKGNPNRYFVATQDKELRREIAASVAGVPLIYIDHGSIILEPASKLTLAEADRRQLAKASKLTTHENNFLKSFNTKNDDDDGKDGGSSKEETQSRKRKKGPSEPNPLSCKKKSIDAGGQTSSNSSFNRKKSRGRKKTDK